VEPSAHGLRVAGKHTIFKQYVEPFRSKKSMAACLKSRINDKITCSKRCAKAIALRECSACGCTWLSTALAIMKATGSNDIIFVARCTTYRRNRATYHADAKVRDAQAEL